MNSHKFTLSVLASVSVGLLSACGGGSSNDQSGNNNGGGSTTPTYTVSTDLSEGGTVSPASATVQQGNTTSFTISPENGYTIESAAGCGGSLSDNVFTTGSITSNCTISIQFERAVYTVTASATEGGAIAPAEITVEHGEKAVFTLETGNDYLLQEVTGCNGVLDELTYTTDVITSECSVSAQFRKGPPRLAVDYYEMMEDTVLTFTAEVVNTDADTVRISISQWPSNGQLEQLNETDFEYTPDQDYHGTDSFSLALDEEWHDDDWALPQIVQTVNIEIENDYSDYNEPSSSLVVWDYENPTFWTGEQLEANIDFCQYGTQRWISPITFFDINDDGVTEILLPISCYQDDMTHAELDAANHKIGTEVYAAWKLFCSSESGHYDCTEEVFGETYINATGMEGGGGNPYLHVIDKPRDLNGNGYPDIYYPLNRDDGRAGFNFDDPEDYALLEEFCGPQPQTYPEAWTWDCTRKSLQSALISNGDGTYQVSFMPFGPQNAQAVTPLPNVDGGYDLFFFIYGPFKAARLEGTEFVDVTEEYETYKNIDYVSTINPYVHSFWHGDTYYLVTPDVPIEAITEPGATDFSAAGHGDRREERLGFTLWEFRPGEGFFLSDFYQPESPVFHYKRGTPDHYSDDFGVEIFGIPVFTPHWHFFEYTHINHDEPPVLVVQTESSGIRVGDHFREAINPSLHYSSDFDRADDLETFIFGSLDIMYGFYIEDGKLIPRQQPVVDGHITFNSPGFKFEDATGDGNMDMYTIAGGADRSSIHLNQSGTLFRIDLLKAYPPISFSIENGPENFGLGIRNLGNAPYLDFLYWSNGFAFWPDYILNQRPSDFGIKKAIKPITEIPLLTVEELIDKATQCAIDGGFYDGGRECWLYR